MKSLGQDIYTLHQSDATNLRLPRPGKGGADVYFPRHSSVSPVGHVRGSFSTKVHSMMTRLEYISAYNVLHNTDIPTINHEVEIVKIQVELSLSILKRLVRMPQ